MKIKNFALCALMACVFAGCGLFFAGCGASTYTITSIMTNVTADAGNITTINTNETKTLKFTAQTGYVLPDTVTVTGATSKWTKGTGSLELSKAIGNVTIKLVAVADVKQFTITKDLTNVTVATTDPTIIKEEETVTLHITASDGFVLPKESLKQYVAVYGATFDLWNVAQDQKTATLRIKNPTGNVTIKVIAVAEVKQFTITNDLTNVAVASTDPTSIKEGETVTLHITASDGFILPKDSLKQYVAVNGATFDLWNVAQDQKTATLRIKNPTGNVTTNITGLQVCNIAVEEADGLVPDETNPTVVTNDNIVTLKFAPVKYYLLPESIVVTGAYHTWTVGEEGLGTLKLCMPSDDVSVVITPIRLSGFYNTNDVMLASLTLEQAQEDASGVAALIPANTTTIVLPNGVTSIATKAFQNQKTLVNMYLPSTLTKIGSYAFGCDILDDDKSCENLEYINLSNVKIINNNAFYKCYKLKDVDLSSIETIGTEAFYYCKALTSLDLSHATSLADLAKYCDHLKTAIWSDNVSEMPSHCFKECTALEYVYIGKVVILSGSAFGDCTALKTIEYGRSAKEWSSVEKTSSWDTNIGNYVLKCSDVTLIKNTKSTAVAGAYDVKGDKIADIKLEDCGNDAGNIKTILAGLEGVVSVALPSGVTSIADGAFSGLDYLQVVYLPSTISPIGIGANAFNGCSALTTIGFAGSYSTWTGLTKGACWDDGTGDYILSCSDAKYTKDSKHIYDIDIKLVAHWKYSSENSTMFIEGETTTLKFIAYEGYVMQTANPNVTNATITSWDYTTGTLELNNITGNVIISLLQAKKIN